MPTVTINLPTPPARPIPTISADDAARIRALITHTSVSRFDAEYVHATEGPRALRLLFAQVMADNLNAWLLCGEHPSPEATALRNIITDTATWCATPADQTHPDLATLLEAYENAVLENLDAWLASGDYPSRPRAPAERLAALTVDGTLDVETATRALSQHRHIGGRA